VKLENFTTKLHSVCNGGLSEVEESSPVFGSSGFDLVGWQLETICASVSELDSEGKRYTRLAIVPILRASSSVVQLPRGLGGVGDVVHREDPGADGVSHSLCKGIIGREGIGPAVWTEDQLGVAVVVNGALERTAREDVICKGFALGLAEGSSTTVGVARRGVRRAHSAPVIIPVSVQVHSVRAASVGAPVLAPQAIGGGCPCVDIPIGVGKRNEIDYGAIQEGLHGSAGSISSNQLVDDVKNSGGGNPFTGVLASIKEELVLGASRSTSNGDSVDIPSLDRCTNAGNKFGNG